MRIALPGRRELRIAAAAAAALAAACNTSGPGAPVIAAFAASPSTLPSGGGTVTLSWTTSNATALALDHGVGDVTGLTSKQVTVTASTTFTLTASSAKGSATATAAVTVEPRPAPVIAGFTASPTQVPFGGGPVTLAWTATGADTLSIDGGVGDVTGLASKQVTVSAPTTFTLTATNTTGSATRTAAVTVAPRPAPQITAFSAAPASVPYGGGPVTLSWTTTGADTLSVDHGVGDVTGLTSKQVTVSAATTFTLTATNPSGSATAAAQVTVQPQPAPAIGSFTASPAQVPFGGGTVTLAWTATDANALSIDHGVGDVTGLTNKQVAVTAPTTFTLTATNTTGTATRTAAVTVAPQTDRFVDAAGGSDSNLGTLAAPFKTITRAMAGTPVNVHLLDGTFDTSTQGVAVINVPDGVALSAVSPGQATLVGVKLQLAGSGVIDGLALDGQTQITAAAATGTPVVTFSGVRLRSTNDSFSGQATLMLGGKVAATLSPGALPGGDYSFPAGALGYLGRLTGTAQLTIQGGSFDGHGVDQSSGLFLAAESSALVLDGVTLKNLGLHAANLSGALGVGGNNPAAPARLTLQHGTLIKDNKPAPGYTSFPMASVAVFSNARLLLDAATIDGGASVAIADGGGGTGIADSQVTIRNGSTLSNNGRALALTFSGGATQSLQVDGATFSGNAAGLRLAGTAATVVDLHLLAYTGNSPTVPGGASFDTAIGVGQLKMRGCSFTGNGGSGFYLGNLPAGAAAPDLGTAASPGGNTFSGNAGSNLVASTGGTIDAAGNTWEANQQGASAAGAYPAGTQVSGAQSGKNYTLYLLNGVATTLNL